MIFKSLISHTYFSIKFLSPLIPKLPNVNQSAPAKNRQSTTMNKKVHDNKPKWIRKIWNNPPPLWAYMTNITNLKLSKFCFILTALLI